MGTSLLAHLPWLFCDHHRSGSRNIEAMFLVHQILFLCQGFRSIPSEQTHQWSLQHHVLQSPLVHPLAVLDQRMVPANSVQSVHLDQRAVAANNVQSVHLDRGMAAANSVHLDQQWTFAANNVQSVRLGEANQTVLAGLEANQTILAGLEGHG